MFGLTFALGSMVFAGLTDFCFKKYVNRAGVPLGSFLAGIGLVWALFFAVPLAWQGGADWRGWPLALAVTHGQVSVVVPVSQLSFIITLLLGWRLLGESLTKYRLLAIASAVCCILAMTRA